jgi:multidrug resistance efflux pump
MIAFLTLIYVAFLFLAVKIGLIRLNTFWKISPAIWMVLLFFVLFVPMQWGAPAGTVNLYQRVIEIIPNVNGEVTAVHVRALEHVEEDEVLFEIDPVQYQAKVDQLHAQINLSQANLERSQDLMNRGVGRQLDVDIYQAEVSNVRAQLANANWELAETQVRAPKDGVVVGLSLRPGQRVTNMPFRSWVAFVEAGEGRLAVGIPQSRIRYVRPGQEAEVVLRLRPGRTLKATVLKVMAINPSAQLPPSGMVPSAPNPTDPVLPYAVILQLEDESIQLEDIPGGAAGTAAIYTDSVEATHVIRRVMMRMETWMNYLLP